MSRSYRRRVYEQHDPPFLIGLSTVSLTCLDRFPLRLLFPLVNREISSYLNRLPLYSQTSRFPLTHLLLPHTPLLLDRFYLIAPTYSFMLQLLATSYLDRLASHIASATPRAATRRRHILTVLSCQR